MGLLVGTAANKILVDRDELSNRDESKYNEHQEASISIDFEKAFDRSNFKFLEIVLNKLQFPKKMINLILSLNNFQSGQLIVNQRITEKSFSFQNGIRQGSPLSPTIFLLIIEPMIYNCSSYIEIHGPFTKTKVTSISYADDANIMVKNKDDLNRVLENFAKYEEVSNMKINLEKSNLITLKKFSGPEARYEEEYRDSPIKLVDLGRKNDINFLGIPMNGDTIWREKMEKIGKQLKFPLLTEIPINVRAKMINLYIMSQVYNLDPHDPLSEEQIGYLDKMIHDTHFKGISIEVLKKLEEHGGFNLMDLTTQLHGRRSKSFHEIITGKNFVSKINKEMIQWLVFCIIILFDDYTSEENVQRRRWWNSAENVPELLYSTIPWTSIFDGQLENLFNENIKGTTFFRDGIKIKKELRDMDIYENHIGIMDILTKILPRFKIPTVFKNLTPMV